MVADWPWKQNGGVRTNRTPPEKRCQPSLVVKRYAKSAHAEVVIVVLQEIPTKVTHEANANLAGGRWAKKSNFKTAARLPDCQGLLVLESFSMSKFILDGTMMDLVEKPD